MKRFLTFALAVILVMSFCFTALAAEYTGEVNPLNVLLVNADTGDILYSKDADSIAYSTDLVKLMTAYVTVKSIKDLDTVVTVSPNALYNIYSTISPALSGYEEITVRDLLAGMLVGTADDCAQALAVYIGGSVSGFVGYMNDYASDLGMTDTVFTNPTGRHYGGQFTTASDMSILACELLKYPELVEIFSAMSYTIPATNVSDERTVYNTNRLLCEYPEEGDFRYEYATGMISGYSNYAAACLAASANKHGVNLVCIILGDISRSRAERWSLAASLFDFGFEQYPPVPAEEIFAEIPLTYTSAEGYNGTVTADFTDIVLDYGATAEGITAVVTSEDDISGTAVYTDADGNTVAEVPVTIALEIPEEPEEIPEDIVEEPEEIPEIPEEPEDEPSFFGTLIAAVISAIVLAAAIFLANLVVQKKNKSRRNTENDSFKVKFRQNCMTYLLFLVVAFILIIIIFALLV